MQWFVGSGASSSIALKRTPAAGLSSDDLSKLYMKYSIGKFDLNDRGYIASIHPLELWTVNSLRDHPLATESSCRTRAAQCALPPIHGSSRRVTTRLRIGAS